MKKESNGAFEFSSVNFPIVRNVSPRTLADDLEPFDPGNPQDVKEWGEMFKSMKDKIETNSELINKTLNGMRNSQLKFD